MGWKDNPKSRYSLLISLEIYRLSRELTKNVYSVTRSFPKHELYGLTSQLNRATVSIGANIAEGNTRRGIKDRLRFMNISKASLSEVIFLLDVASELEYIKVE